jgi:hypothetical protein
MIINNNVKTIIKSKKALNYYKGKNYNFKLNKLVTIKVKDLPKSSRIKILAKCAYCGGEKNIPYKDYNKQVSGINEKYACSLKCAKLKTKETNQMKYGVDNVFSSEKIKKQIKKTNLEKYGVENYRNSKEYSMKYESTVRKKYNTNHYSKTKKFKEIFENFNYDDIHKKMANTIEKKYGVKNYSKTKEFKTKIQKKNFDNFSEKISSIGKLVSIKNKQYTIKCNSCGEEYKILHTLLYTRNINNENPCTYCNPKNEPIKEKEIFNFVNNYIENVKGNIKIDKKEIDVYLPDYNLGIEYNGLYWHCELYKNRNYHFDKTNICNKKNIDLLHIWEDQWLYKQPIVKSMILNKLNKTPNKIYARKTEIKEITDTKIVSEFLEKNHLQGKVGSNIKIGLYYNNELVSLMTFGKLRKNLGQKHKNNYYEMLRFCNKLYTNVIGGASKLFKYFLKNYKPTKIISYANRDYSNGNLYKKLGFKLDKITKPNYHYVKNGLRYNRYNFRKDKLIKKGYDSAKTEHEIMLERKYYRIYNSGNFKFSYKLS